MHSGPGHRRRWTQSRRSAQRRHSLDHQAQGYRKPTVDDLIHAIGDALKGHAENFAAVSLALPGLLDEQRKRVMFSVNVPALSEIVLDDLVSRALGRKPDTLCIANDSIASGYDIHATRKLPGRLLVLALGTGVGAAVLDDGIPLKVDGESPGHVGQFDVSVEGDPLIGPDGGAGSLEGYIGAPALRHRYGSDPASKIRPNDPPIRALAKAIRICHAIYRPHHIVLAGGLGIRLGRTPASAPANDRKGPDQHRPPRLDARHRRQRFSRRLRGGEVGGK